MAYDTYKCPDFPQSPSLPPNYTCVEVYTVKAGDTLYAISQAYGVPVAVLMQVNRILNPYNLKIGQKICIPGKQNNSNNGSNSGDNCDNGNNGNNGSNSGNNGGNGGNNGGSNSGSNGSNGGNNSGTMPVCNGKMHTIAKGDTLYMIAKKYQVPLAVIMRANPNIDPYNLKIGQQLCIPNFPPADEPATPPTGGTPVPPTPSLPSCRNGRPYVTQRGDTLTRILDRFDITYGQLLAANPDVDFEGSLETLTLCIPYKDGESEDCGDMCAYTIQAGDTLDSISQKFRIIADNLLMANPDMTTIDFTKPGTVICLPK